MSRKHFQAIAAALKDICPNPGSDGFTGAYESWWEAVRAIADVCEATNDQFNRALFFKACEGT